MAIPVMNAGADATLGYSSITGGSTSYSLTGSATVSSPGTEISSWLWILLEKPEGSDAEIDSPTSQSPNLINIDASGTYRLLLTGVDDADQSSVTDKLKAPSSSFCNIRVVTETLELVKPAPSERNWHTHYHNMVDSLESWHAAFETHVDDNDPHNTLSSDGSVIVTNTPETGEILSADSATSASWKANAAAVPVATTSTLGKVRLTEAPFDADNPRAVTRDKVVFTAQCAGSLIEEGFTPWTVRVPHNPPGTAGPSSYAVAFNVPFEVTVTSLGVAFANGGSEGGKYTLSMRKMTETQYRSNAVGTEIASLEIVHNSGGPSTNVELNIDEVVAGRDVLVLYVEEEPDRPGNGMTVTVTCYQNFT